MEKENCPSHVAIILDGNGRWAQQQGRERTYGHQKGAENVKEIVRAAGEMGVKTLTVYAFSTENWKRPVEEVHFLMELFGEHLLRNLEEMHKEHVQIHIVGDRTALSDTLNDKIRICEEKTEFNEGIHFNMAVNYGGRHELVQAFRQMADQVAAGKLCPEDITEQTIQKHLYAPSSGDVDLLIRTGGECRISNFLPWQLSYSELYFTSILWPDFHTAEFQKALSWFAGRARRFGGLQEGELPC